MVSGNGISFSGLASGLDTQAIVQQLVALERIPITLVETQKREEQDKLNKVDALADLVKALQESARTLSTAADFFAYTVSNSDETVASIDASGAALDGSHTLEVLQVASVDRWAFNAVTNADTDLASADGQQITFDIGTTQYSLVVNQVDSSLNELATAINNMAGTDVTATVVNTGAGSNPQYRLVLASENPGEDLRITNIATNIAGLSITYSAPDANGNATSANNITVGNNALAVIDGLSVERSSNDLSDVFPGIEITLLSTTSGTPITFSVDADREAIRANIDTFISSYNDVIGFINQQSTFTPSEDEEDNGGSSGVLFGDTILRSVQRGIGRALFDIDPTVVQNDTLGFSTLGLVGIQTQSDGTLKVDDTTLDAKLLENLDAFADLFIDYDGFDNGGADPNTAGFFTDQTADSGLAATLVREIDRMFGTFEGPIDPNTGERIVLDALFDLRKEAIKDSIDRFDDRISMMERRLETFEQNLVLRFARLEELMGSLNAQGTALNSILGDKSSNQ